MKKLFISLLAFAMVITSAPLNAFALTPASMGEKPADGITFDQPFAPGTGTSQKFRIPALATLEDGTVIAGIDARWNTYMDGGGLDTIVSSSKDNGETWYYTYANYLGDFGNTHNGKASCFIDPAFAVDGNRVYMMVDLWPGAYALNGATYAPIAGQNGFDAEGHLRLTDVLQNNSSSVAYNYHLVEKANPTVEDYYEIRRNSDNTVVEGYTIDAYYNLTSQNDDTNLFYWDSPFKVYPTNYLWVNYSDDAGKTWSTPTLANVKYESEQTFLVAPGTGLVVDLPDGTKRIMYTGYEFTSGDKNSWVIYSDDGGKTWERGAKCSGWSSESTITQVGEKIYIFTRHGVCYYVSDDYGETFSEPISSGISYNSNCMIHSITYSKKVDGKDAIILSAPSNTGARKDGKLYVGLVQEDGSIEWKYEKAVDNKENNQAYAYSCLTELKDGRIALLYENIDAGAKYEVFTMDEITGGAAVGNTWITFENSKEAVNHVVLDQEYMILNIKGEGFAQGATVESSDKSLVVAGIDGNGLYIRKQGDQFGQVTLTLKDKTKELTLKVTVVDENTNSINSMTLVEGEEKEIFDGTGDYMEVPVEGIDTSIATLEALSAEGEFYEIQLGTNSSFNGDKTTLDECLVTFNTTNTDNVFTITKDINGTTYYLGTKGAQIAGIPMSTTQTTVTLEPQAENQFAIKDNSTANNNGKYLYFHKDTLRFNRNSTLAGENTQFYILESKNILSQNMIVSGYVPVTQFEDGKQYLIAAVGQDGETYVLHPSTNTSNVYAHVAKVLSPFEDEFGTTFKLTAKKAGTTFAKVADTLYIINVLEKECKELTIGVGDTFALAGELTENTNNTVIEATTSTEAVAGPYSKNDGELASGKYLIGNDTHLAAHIITKEDWEQTGLKLMAADFETGSYGNELWTVTKVEGGYYIQNNEGEYVNFTDKSGASASIKFTNTPQVLTITNKATQGYDVTYVLNGTKYYFNNFGGANTNKLIAGYTDNGVNWRFYTPTAKETVVKGLEAGQTTAVVGGVEYKINVVATADYTRVDNALKLVEEAGNLKQYTQASRDALNIALAAVVRDLPYASQAEVNEMAANIYLAVNQLVIDENAVLEADKEALAKLVEDADKVEADKYTEETYAAFAAVLDQAKQLLANIDATQEEVDALVVALTEAMEALKEKPAEKPLPFEDVSEKQWYHTWVKEAYNLGLMTGATETLFKPNSNMNRGMVAIVFHRMEGSKKVEYSKVFPDVANNQYYTTSVLWAKANGVINGYTDGTFKPLKNVTREEMVTMIYNFAKYKGLDVKSEHNIKYFNDYAKITQYAKAPLRWAVENELISGKDNGTRLDPLGTATRAECCKMLVQAYKVIYK